MKTCKFLRITTAILAILLAVFLLAISVLTVLPFVSATEVLGILAQMENGIITIVSELTFLQALGSNAGAIVFVAVTFFLPSVLLLVASAILISKQKNGRGKYVFASIVTILGTAVFAVIFEIFAEKLLGESALLGRIAIGVVLAISVLFGILTSVCKTKQTTVVYAPVDGETTEQTTNSETEPLTSEDSEILPENEQEEPKQETIVPPVTEYIPENCNSVSDIVEHTYGNKVETVSAVNLKKIETARSLLDANVISKDEYIALVDAYLKDNK